MNHLNDEIRAIQSTICFYEKKISLEPSQGVKKKLKEDKKELERILSAKLGEDNNYEY